MTLTRYGVDPVSNLVPAWHKKWAINLNELDVVDVHVERMLIRAQEVPLMDFPDGQIEQVIVRSREWLASYRLTNLPNVTLRAMDAVSESGWHVHSTRLLDTTADVHRKVGHEILCVLGYPQHWHVFDRNGRGIPRVIIDIKAAQDVAKYLTVNPKVLFPSKSTLTRSCK